VYVEYSKKHNVRGKAFTLNNTVVLLGLAIFSYKAIVMAMGHQLLIINHFKACLTIT